MNCVTEPCRGGFNCPLPGGCVQMRFPDNHSNHTVRAMMAIAKRIDEGLRDDAPALNGTKAKVIRDPRFIRRNRKALTP